MPAMGTRAEAIPPFDESHQAVTFIISILFGGPCFHVMQIGASLITFMEKVFEKLDR